MPSNAFEINFSEEKWCTIWRMRKCKLRQHIINGDLIFCIGDKISFRLDEYFIEYFFTQSMCKSFRKALKTITKLDKKVSKNLDESRNVIRYNIGRDELNDQMQK